MENLPKELIEYLKPGKQFRYETLECECGKVKLKTLSELQNDFIWVEAEHGYYEIPAISLLKSCEGYNPDGILVWLPNEQLWGTWDDDHWELRVFEGASWANIIKNPVRYLNAQWHDSKNQCSKLWSPSAQDEIKLGRPY